MATVPIPLTDEELDASEPDEAAKSGVMVTAGFTLLLVMVTVAGMAADRILELVGSEEGSDIPGV
jgi:hypothetical protein